MSPTTVTVYADPLTTAPGGAIPEPFIVSVTFTGNLPLDALGQTIPLQISVSLPEELSESTQTVIRAIRASNGEPATTCLGTFNHRSSDQYGGHSPFGTPPPDHEIPFLPLSSSFVHTDRTCWAELSSSIHAWLLQPPNTRDWTWGLDAFWIAFVAANPAFPSGSWPDWDSNIPMDGPFIDAWVSGDFLGNDGSEVSDREGVMSTDAILGQLWTEFQRHAALCFPFDIIGRV